MIKLIIRNPREIVEGDILHLKVLRKWEGPPGVWELVVEHIVEKEHLPDILSRLTRQ